MNLQQIASFLFSAVRVVGSTVAGKHSVVLVGGDGSGGAGMTDAEAYGGLGLVFRPRPPETVDGEELHAEAMSARLGSGLTPLAWRDVRLHRAFSNPKEGTMALVGYGGGFLAIEDTANKLSAMTMYVPYAYSGGEPQKAMAVAIDPEQESLMLVHGDGYAVVLDKDNGITNRSSDGKSYTQLKGGAFSVVADTISLQGNVSAGANTATAIPLLPGVASQPTTSVFFSPS